MTLMQEIALRQSLMFGGLITGLVFGLIFAAFFCYRQPSWLKSIFKGIPILAFFVAGFANFGAAMVLIALVISWLGDFAFSRKGHRAVLLGIWNFAIVHVIYGIHFLPRTAPENTSMAFIVTAVALAVSTEFWLTPHAATMKWPVRIYTAAITFMAVTAVMIPNSVLPSLGAIAFVASSALAGLCIFHLQKSSHWALGADVGSWLFYILAQAAILAGTGFVNPLFSI